MKLRIFKRFRSGVLTNCFLLTTTLLANTMILNNSVSTKDLNSNSKIITSEDKNKIYSGMDDNLNKLKSK